MEGGVAPMSPSPDMLLKLVEQNDEKHEDGHKRLRVDYRELDARITKLEASQAANETHFTKIDTTPTDVSQLHFTPQIVLLIVTTCLTVAGGMWASTYGLRSDVRDILTRMNNQATLDQMQIRLQDERSSALKADIEEEKRQRLLLKYDLETKLKEMTTRSTK